MNKTVMGVNVEKIGNDVIVRDAAGHMELYQKYIGGFEIYQWRDDHWWFVGTANARDIRKIFEI